MVKVQIKKLIITTNTNIIFSSIRIAISRVEPLSMRKAPDTTPYGAKGAHSGFIFVRELFLTKRAFFQFAHI